MNNKNIRNYQIFSMIFTFILGTFLHFTYNLSNQNQIVALFSAINESVWEHLKLLYFPMLITLIIGYLIYGKTFPNFVCAKTIGMLIAMVFTVIFHYTYTGIIGKHIAVIDIGSFFVATIIGEYVSYKLISSMFKCKDKVWIFILIIFFICFTIFTYFPLNLAIFKPPFI